MNQDKEFLDRKQVQRLVTNIGKKINYRYKDCGQPVVLFGVLNGAAMFMNDLAKRIEFPVIMQYTKCRSYSGTSKGRLVYDYWPDFDFTDKHVIIVEDIVDTGGTIREIIESILKENNPASISVAALLKRENCPCFTEYLGKQVPEGLWIYGYGMDYPDGLNRNLSSIYIKT